MEQTKKKILLGMVYYALVSVAILMGVIFMIYLATQDVALYAKISLWILTDVLIGLIIFDIICTNIRKLKYIAGIILYICSLVTIVMSIITYITISTNLILTAVQVFPYLALLMLSWVINIFVILQYFTGLKIIEIKPKRAVKSSK